MDDIAKIFESKDPPFASSNPPATTNTLRNTSTDQGTTQNLQASSRISSDQGIGLKQAKVFEVNPLSLSIVFQ